jgi:hypothetical protein
VADGPPPLRTEQQKLLQDTRAKCDDFAQEKARVENLLNLALEKVKLYQTLLGATESKLCSVEDLIGDICFHLQEWGLPIHTITFTSRQPTPSEMATGAENPETDHPPGMCPPLVSLRSAYICLSKPDLTRSVSYIHVCVYNPNTAPPFPLALASRPLILNLILLFSRW